MKKWKEMSKLQKIMLLGLLSVIIIPGSVYGAWLFFIQSPTITANIVSNEPSEVLQYTTPLTNFAEIDTSNSSESIEKGAVMTNSNGDLTDLTITIVNNVTDGNLTDSCTDFTNDITATWELDGTEVQTNDVVNLTSGDHNVNVTLDVVQNACPLIWNGSIGLTQ